MNLRLSRWMGSVLLILSAMAMFTVASDAEARRFGGGMRFGKQSSNVTQQRQAVKPPAAAQNAQRTATTGAAAAGTAAKSGMSRWMGPLVGIAAGLGIAALLSSLGLSGAFLELMSSLALIALVAFAVLYLVRRLRGASRPMAPAGHSYRQAEPPAASWPPASATPSASASAVSESSPVIEAAASPVQDASWFIPADFDVPGFLEQAKQRFVQIQMLWDAGNRETLREYLTDDLLTEVTPQLPQLDEGNRTEVVLLNAELLGIETVAGGYLASVRYSGMLREAAGAEAFRFEEVWNLYKADGEGWLLAGIQQLDSH